MLILRVIGFLSAIGIGVLVLMFVFTGERRFLRMAWRVFQVVLALVLIMFGLLIFERLMVASL